MKSKRFIIIVSSAIVLICGCSKDNSKDESKETTTIENSFETSEVTSTADNSGEITESSAIESKEESSKDPYYIEDGPIELGGKVEQPSIDTGECVYDTENITKDEYTPYSIRKYVGNETKLVIPAEIDGEKILYINSNTFYGMTKLEEIYIEDGVEVISKGAFKKCISLKKIRLPSTLKSIEESAFEDCINLTEIYIPDSVSSIGSKAFVNCDKLEKVRMPSTITVGSEAFVNCVSLKGEAIIPSGNKYVSQTYKDCTGITKMTICEGPTRIFPYTFDGMTGLREVVFPESAIDFYEVDRLFKDSENLEAIYVKKGSYAEYVFRDSPWSDIVVSVGGQYGQ